VVASLFGIIAVATLLRRCCGDRIHVCADLRPEMGTGKALGQYSPPLSKRQGHPPLHPIRGGA
jgi:hypothetical protein